jgi:hypothetical protein
MREGAVKSSGADRFVFSTHLAPIFKRIHIPQDNWLELTRNFGRRAGQENFSETCRTGR